MKVMKYAERGLVKMLKNKKVKILSIIMFLIFGVTFSVGVFSNPNFNIHDFCMNLASEILGLVIALVLVETYIKEKEKAAASQKKSPSDKED